MKTNRIPITKLESNTGQIPGLPMNPRQWTKGDVESLAASLLETPELFEARPIIAVPHGGKYVILGGNMRYEASKLNKAPDVPCFVLPEDTPVDKMKEIVIKDNGAWGSWDYEALTNEWYELPLLQWGVSDWYTGEKPTESITDEALPEELQGKDLTPDEMDKIVGEDETEYERIIITYEEGEQHLLDEILGIENTTAKVIWTMDDILKSRA